MSKYSDFGRLLNVCGKEVVRLNFKDIEEALGFSLPASARKHAEWWSNNYTGHVQARAWMDAGWQTEALDLEGKKVSFRRSASPSTEPGSTPQSDASGQAIQHRRDPWGCMAGTVTFMPDVDLTEPTEEWDAEHEPSR